MKTADFHIMVVPPMENPPKDALDEILDWGEGRGIDFREAVSNLISDNRPPIFSRGTKVQVELNRI